MRYHAAVAIAVVLTMAAAGQAEQNAGTSQNRGRVTVLRCGSLIDGKSEQSQRNVEIRIEGEKVTAVGRGAGTSQAGAHTIDLSRETCLPGLIDTHTHVLLQGDVTTEDYNRQILQQSDSYRTILGTVAARRALAYGFTTIRDLETEGAGYSDVDVKTAINKGIIPGPRMQVATRAMDVTGAYPVLGFRWDWPDWPHGVQVVDGADEGRKAVREQISKGADWIKVYVDGRYFLRPDGVLEDVPTFTPDELRAIVDETHRERHKIAAHAAALHGVHNAVDAGVDSIEHGMYIAPEDMKMMLQKGTYYVPTLFVGEYVAQGRAAEGAPVWQQMVSVHAATFKRAVQAGVKIAFGTDAGDSSGR